MTATVTPIRPGLQWTPNIAYMHALPPGIKLLDLNDYRAEGRGRCQLSFHVFGEADALVAGGFTTHELLASIPRSGKKTIREKEPIDHFTHLYRRKAGYRVDTCLYGEDNSEVPRYIAMFGLDRKASQVKAQQQRMTRGGLALAEMYEQLNAGRRVTAEALIRGLLVAQQQGEP